MSLPSFDYFDHEADIGIIGRGETIETAFAAAAQAVFDIMSPLNAIKPEISIEINFTESDLELALVRWLNLLISEARVNNLIFCKFSLQRNEKTWFGRAWGEHWRDDLERGTEVKGATLTMLSIKKINTEWEVRCVVDV